MLLTQLEYFVAIARERHFGRAAAACFVSASALSESLHKLELELGAPLVRRGRAFEGLTPEGELALIWARKVLADDKALRDQLAVARDRLASTIRIGVIPAAVTRAAELVARLTERHPLTRVSLRTGLTTEEIVRGIRAYELDAGLIHPAVDDGDLTVIPLYHDRMMVVGSEAFIGDDVREVEGSALRRLPTSLLVPQMRARQALDAALRDHDLELSPSVEVDSVEGLLALASTGATVAVVPESAIDPAHVSPHLRAVPLRDPEVTLSIALAVLAEEPRSPVAAAVADLSTPSPSDDRAAG